MSQAAPASQRIALGVEYDGSNYSGWQAQKSPETETVQEALESALSQVADSPVKVICAGRTDSGVHANGQVVHFDTDAQRELKAWVLGSNNILPPGISVLWAQVVPDNFHARFSARSRCYRYVICNTHVRHALCRGRATFYRRPLDAETMHQAGQLLLGENDFSSFRGAGCQSKTPMRNVIRLDVSRQHRFVMIDIEANAFLLHMVRNIAGVLLEIGAGDRDPAWAGEVLALRDRRCAGVTARPDGLYLVKVVYPADFRLPAGTDVSLLPVIPA